MPTAEIRSILVATGLGAESDAPVRLAAFLATRAHASLHLLHALELQSIAPALENETASDFQTLIERAKGELVDQARRATPEGVEPASLEVIIYVPHKAILNRANQVQADLIVLGAHRRRPRGDQLLGPTPDRVIRSAAAPCLIVPEIEPRPFRRIVAPIDIGMPAVASLDLARVWARDFGSDGGTAVIDALYVAPVRNGVISQPRPQEAVEAALETVIARSANRVARESAGGVPVDALEVRPVIRRGREPATAILDYVEEVDADLVVLGTRGFGAIRRALIGSVASTVARRAPCPVLLVPPVLWRGADRG